MFDTHCHLTDPRLEEQLPDVLARAALREIGIQKLTLLPGTLIFTGTPHGVGMAQKPPLWLKPGDEVSVTIEKIGTLTNPVA